MVTKKIKKASSNILSVEVNSLQELVKETKKTQERLVEVSNTLATTGAMVQKNTVDLITHMSDLMTRLDKIFPMFEEASKHVGDVETAEGKISNLSTKLEALLDQNKSIAQGLVLLEKYVRGKTRLEPAIQPKPLE